MMKTPKFIKRSKIWQDKFRYIAEDLNVFLNNRKYREWKNEVQLKTTLVHIADSNGLGDRLKGAVFLYGYCKKANIPFKFFHLDPFDIRSFLEPNKYDWKIDKEEIEDEKSSSEILDGAKLKLNSFLRLLFMNKYVKERLCYANVKYILLNHYQPIGYLNRDYKFSELFNELFRPTQLVQERLDYYKNVVGGGGVAYISISSRFAGLIGDFNETWNKPLSEDERDKLLNNCIAQVEILHKKYPDKKILVCSDSITFLEMAKKLPYVFVIDGVPVHVNFSTQSDIQTHLKTFVDFFMIAGAEKIYLLQSGKMYHSEFPITAASCSGKECELIKF